ncbi:hypothetical protein [Streptomyces sp. NBC_00878]|uniref:hypothetical protein n=1 Tax=Streptomyces sp. NBC_00878 TaxID=2975854 RepID=UPI00225581F4|nr:hypothetical protein [Streptomyces sp. NBC_00878]MCX4908460.1 hypothetical protein [Streptomyces sp. NBC_00878]
MRRGLVHGLAWSLATGAAVTLSWWGVHTVLAVTAYDPPRALPITADGATTQSSKPLASPTSRPDSETGREREESKSRERSTDRSPSPSAPKSARATPSEGASGGAGSTDTSGEVKSYDTDGGRVVFDLGTSSASLVSATPASPWSMQVWKTETWIRVEFAAGADRVSVFCTWHDSAPRVSINDY